MIFITREIKRFELFMTKFKHRKCGFFFNVLNNSFVQRYFL